MTSNINTNPYINMTPEQYRALVEQAAQQQAIQQEQARQQSWSSDPNAPYNLGQEVIGDLREAGTALNYLALNLNKLPGMTWDYLTNPESNPVVDIPNAILSQYNTKVEDFGSLPASEILKNIGRGAAQNPVWTGLDLVTLGAGGLARKALGIGGKAADVEKGVASVTSKIATDSERAYKAIEKTNQLASKNNVDLKKIVEAAEEGTELATAGEKEVLSSLKDFSKITDDLAKRYSPETYVGPEKTAITQKVLRDELKANPSATYAQVERDLTPIYEMADAGKFGDIKKLADGGNVSAIKYIDAKDMFDRGRIFPVSHGLANVEKMGETLMRGSGDLAGRFSRRAYGNSTYDDIAKEISSPDNYLNGMVQDYTQKAVARQMLGGMVGDYSILPAKASDAMYVSRELLEKGDLKGAVVGSANKAKLPTDIAVDKNVLKAMKDQLLSDKPLGPIATDLVNLVKGSTLASGTYLAGNVATGLANAVINSGPMVVADFVNAIKSRGQLSKQLGTFRRNVKPTKIGTEALRPFDILNRYTGSTALRQADRAIQNVFSEIAAHSEMRKMGIKPGDRAAAMGALPDKTVGQMVADVRDIALIPSPNLPLNGMARELAYFINPFWRYPATAVRSNIRLQEKAPLIANVALQDILAPLCYDKEMQNRMQLGVYSDKPYVHYKVDDRTGKIMEVSSEFFPQLNTIKLADIPAQLQSGFSISNPNIPTITSLVNALKGKDKYGNPMRRGDQDKIITQVANGKRYEFVNGQWQEMPMGKLDEIIATIAKEWTGAPQLWNRTLAPAIAPFVSPTGQYYQPYGQSIFGSFGPSRTGANLLTGGDPKKARSLDELMYLLQGAYVREYNPQYEASKQRGLGRQDIQAINKARSKDMQLEAIIRNFGNGNR